MRLTSNRTERLNKGSVIFASNNGSITELVVQAAREHQDRWLVTFAGRTNRNAAEELRGAQLMGEPLDDPDTLWVHELVGCVVVEIDGTEHGKVVELEANPASDLLVLDSGGLVPLTFLVELSEGRLVVDTPPGLFNPVAADAPDPGANESS